MHLADAFIQSDLQCIQANICFISMCVPWELNPRPFALLTQCSTTEPQEATYIHVSTQIEIVPWLYKNCMCYYAALPCWFACSVQYYVCVIVCSDFTVNSQVPPFVWLPLNHKGQTILAHTFLNHCLTLPTHADANTFGDSVQFSLS